MKLSTKKQVASLCCGLALLCVTGGASAAIPAQMNYQGVLQNGSGTPVSGNVSITFRLYNAASGGAAVWQETQPSVAVSNGGFNVVLGAVTPLSLPFDVPYWLGVTVNSDAEMSPRQPLTGSPYAFRAASLESTASIPAAQLTGTLASGQFAATQLLPASACSQNQVPQWSGTAWICGDVAGGVNASLTGNLTLVSSTATVGNIMKGADRFIHNFGTRNTFVGVRAGNGSMTGIDNAGFGHTALPSNSTGSNNTAVGSQAMFFNSGGGDNTAVGSVALSTNSIGSSNTAVGSNAMRANTTGGHNTVTGKSAMALNTTGNNNTAIGVVAMAHNTTGTSNTAIGTSALGSNTTGGYNTALGENALYNSTIGLGNTAIGFQAGINLASGDGNILINHGGVATESTTLRIGNVTRAFVAGIRGVTPAQASLQPVVIDSDGQLGTLAAFPAPTIDNVTNLTFPASTATAGNIMKGTSRFIHNFGTNNTFVGVNAGNFSASLTGANNTAMGTGALQVLAGGANNTATGSGALLSNSTGSSNSAFGTSALAQNSGGVENVAAGAHALFTNSVGEANVATGSAAMYSNTIGTNNVAVGRSALYANTTGSNNIAIGYNAGNLPMAGNGNIHIGHPGEAADSNTIRIGSGDMALGQTRAFLAGVRGAANGIEASMVTIDSNGQLGTIFSSRRFKETVADMGEASSALMALRPVTFHYKADQNPAGRSLQYGLIAEEVAEIYPGLVARSADGQIETVLYQFLPPMLLNEVQKQQRTIDAQAAKIRRLEDALAAIQTRLGMQ